MVKVRGSSSNGPGAGPSSAKVSTDASNPKTTGTLNDCKPARPKKVIATQKYSKKVDLSERSKRKRAGNSSSYLEGMFRFLETSANRIKRFSTGTIGRTPAAPLFAIDSFKGLLPKVDKKLSKKEKIRLAKIEWKKLRDAEEEHEKNYRRKKTRQ